MARKTNWEKYTPGSIKDQAHLESSIKRIMDNKDAIPDQKYNELNQLLDGFVNNTENKNNNEDDNAMTGEPKEQALNRVDFDEFEREYKGYSATKAAVSLTAFIAKIIPKVIARLTMKAGHYIDLAGTAIKGAGHELAIGDLGRSIGPKDTDLEYNPHREYIEARTMKNNKLGLVSGVGKLVSEIGSNLGGMGAALDTVTSLDISSPTKRLINDQKKKNTRSPAI